MLALEYDSELERQAWLEEGHKQGQAEKSLEVVKNLLKMRLSISDIMKATGWTEEQILKVANGLDKGKFSMTIDEMRRELQRRLNKKRFAHSIGVATVAVKLAKRFGVDATKAYIAGLLHDCAREFEDEDLPAQAQLRGIEIGEVEQVMPLLLHPYIGAQMIKEIYGVDDTEISQAIYRHTVGAKNMTKLDKIIYFADMIEPNRNYPGVEKLRALAETADLDEILLTAFNETIIFVVQKNSLVHPDTVAARNFLLLNK